MRRGGFSRLLAGTIALAFGLGLAMLALVILLAASVVDPNAGTPIGEGYVALLLNKGEGMPVLSLLLHNTLVLGLYAIVGVVLAIGTLRISSASSSASVEQTAFTVFTTRALSLVGLARNKQSAPSFDRGFYFSSLGGVVLAMFAQAWQLGQMLGGFGFIRDASALDLVRAFPHGPFEMTALAVPLAVILVCVVRRRRAQLPRLLAAALPLAFSLLVVAAFLEAYAPGLIAL